MTRPYTPEELLERIIPHLDQRKLRRRVTKDGKQVQARCLFHDDDEPSLSLTLRNGELLAYCFNCGKVYDRLLELAGIDSATARPITPRRNAGRQPATAQAQPLTLAALANAKRLDAEKLIAWHVRELPDGGIEILYLTREGELHAVRYRLALEGTNRFRWRKDDTPILYGLWRLPEWGDADTIYLCEGESDTWTLWHAGLAALGIPGASMWKPEWWRNLWEFGRIVIIPDADNAGAGLVEKLASTCPDHLRGQVYVLCLPEGVKDANELWQQLDADAEGKTTRTSAVLWRG
jgi:putative DNA primase/helicase